MTDHDKQVVESMCKYGFDLDTLLDGFQGLDSTEIKEVYKRVMGDDVILIPVLKTNCS